MKNRFDLKSFYILVSVFMLNLCIYNHSFAAPVVAPVSINSADHLKHLKANPWHWTVTPVQGLKDKCAYPEDVAKAGAKGWSGFLSWDDNFKRTANQIAQYYKDNFSVIASKVENKSARKITFFGLPAGGSYSPITINENETKDFDVTLKIGQKVTIMPFHHEPTDTSFYYIRKGSAIERDRVENFRNYLQSRNRISVYVVCQAGKIEVIKHTPRAVLECGSSQNFNYPFEEVFEARTEFDVSKKEIEVQDSGKSSKIIVAQDGEVSVEVE